MSKWEYFINVALPLWWREAKTVVGLIISALLFFLVAVPIGFLLDKKEKRNRKI